MRRFDVPLLIVASPVLVPLGLALTAVAVALALVGMVVYMVYITAVLGLMPFNIIPSRRFRDAYWSFARFAPEGRRRGQ